MLPICGLQKTSLVDYNGYLSSTIFLGYCNYKCPFCQNAELTHSTITVPMISEDTVLAHLEKRKGILEAVCITGGEPTLHPELPSFIEKIKSLGYLIKLDTNGTNATLLNSLIQSGNIDYVAMDIKNSLDAYSISTGTKNCFLEEVEQCIAILKENRISYEFRTTLIKEHHTKERLLKIGTWLKGDSTYILQNFKLSNYVPDQTLHGFSNEELQEIKQLLHPFLPNTHLRGESY